jgi:hypothetical protein
MGAEGSDIVNKGVLTEAVALSNVEVGVRSKKIVGYNTKK